MRIPLKRLHKSLADGSMGADHQCLVFKRENHVELTPVDDG
jgi:hypothetical protein